MLKGKTGIYDCSGWRSPFLPDHVRPGESLPVAALAGWGEAGPLGILVCKDPSPPSGKALTVIHRKVAAQVPSLARIT